MKIQWNSDAAQEALSCLRRAERGLQGCLRQAQTVRAALREANKDGENKQLNKVSETFDGYEKRLRLLLEDVDAYEAGVRRADAGFSEAEQRIMRLVEDLGGAAGIPPAGGTGGYVQWSPGVYTVTPNMRVGIAPMPAWLEQAAEEAAV